MEATISLPLTMEQRLALPDELRVPASWSEFLELLPNCPYRIEYDKHEIISIMGYASEEHELIVAEIIRLLGNLLESPDYRISGSNLALHVPDRPQGYFNADCTVVKGPTERIALKGEMYAVANPVLLVEVLSTSSYDHDLGRKFQHYRQIPSLQQVLFIDSTEYSLINQTRIPGTEEWTLQEYNDLSNECAILSEGSISLQAIYRKVTFPS